MVEEGNKWHLQAVSDVREGEVHTPTLYIGAALWLILFRT